MSPTLLAAGYLNVDIIATLDRVPSLGERAMSSGISRSGGGMTANAACAAARLGLTTRFFGTVGRDPEGDLALRELEEFGVRTDRVARVDRPTTTAIVLLGPGGERAVISEPMTLDPTPIAAAVEEYGEEMRGCIHVDGDQLHAMLPLMRRARELGFCTSADLDGIEPDDAPQVVPAIVPALDVVVLNHGLAAALAESPEATVAMLIRLGARVVAITLGAEGAVVGEVSGTVRIAAPEVEVRDTTGAGDAFTGAFLAAWLEAADVGYAGRFAVAASALSVTGSGARGYLPGREEVMEALETNGGIIGNRSE